MTRKRILMIACLVCPAAVYAQTVDRSCAALPGEMQSHDRTADVNPAQTIRLVAVEADVATRMRVRTAQDSEWKRIRLFALRESTQRSVRKKALEWTKEWCGHAKSQSDSIEMRVYVEAPSTLTAVDLTYTFTWGNGAYAEERNVGKSQLSQELLFQGLAKLDEREVALLERDVQVTLGKAQSYARENKLGMWRSVNGGRAATVRISRISYR